MTRHLSPPHNPIAAVSGDNHVPADGSLGQLVATATRDLSLLMKQEVELAKLEIKRDVVNAGKGAAGLGAGGVLALFGVLLLSAGAAFGIGQALEVWAGFLIVGGVYVLLALIALLFGKQSLGKVGPPEHTRQTVKDDVAWAKHPTTNPTKHTAEAPGGV